MARETVLTRDMRGLEQTRPADARIGALAAQQHGVVSRFQLLGLGVGEDAIDRRLRSGRLHRLYRGVYAVGHSALSLEGRWLAAVLACRRGGLSDGDDGHGVVLSHHAAAALWRIRSPSGRAIDVTAGHKSSSSASIRRHHVRLRADEVTVERGIPVTTAPRTLFDLAAVASVDAVERALRESEYLRLYDRLSLPDLLARYPRQRGSRVLRKCLSRCREAPGRVRSRLEERFLPFLRRYRLPRPQFNAWIALATNSYEVDCLWRAQRQVVELDGYEGHGTRGAFREDRARDRRLRVAGYGVTRIAWAQLDDEPEEIAADLRMLLGVGKE